MLPPYVAMENRFLLGFETLHKLQVVARPMVGRCQIDAAMLPACMFDMPTSRKLMQYLRSWTIQSTSGGNNVNGQYDQADDNGALSFPQRTSPELSLPPAPAPSWPAGPLPPLVRAPYSRGTAIIACNEQHLQDAMPASEIGRCISRRSIGGGFGTDGNICSTYTYLLLLPTSTNYAKSQPVGCTRRTPVSNRMCIGV